MNVDCDEPFIEENVDIENRIAEIVYEVACPSIWIDEPYLEKDVDSERKSFLTCLKHQSDHSIKAVK